MPRRSAGRDPSRLVALALTATSLVALGVAVALRPRLEPQAPELLAWIACGWAVASPVVAILVRGGGLIASPESPADAGSPGRRVAFFGVLESAVLLCAVALLVARPEWPLLAAALPFAVMLVNLPRPGS